MINVLVFAAFAAAAVGLVVYTANCYVMVLLYLRTRHAAAEENARVIAAAAPRFAPGADLPWVTTQIPIYNEANVVERAMRAAAAIDYPANRHEVQVLDDSTDETGEIIDRVAALLRRDGHNIQVVRRRNRAGFKAGALAEGLREARGQFVAIFDADFTPPREFLRSTLPFFFRDDRLGLVQARWGHLNALESPLTRAQAIGIDGHFMVEQSARAFNGLFMNFNGTAGVWRRAAIEDAGGWSADTLTEDLDLSYRAQLRGWHTRYLAGLIVPGELPASLAAFKGQQFRWAKGSIQTARKLLPEIWRDDRLSGWVKFQATLHLTHYLVHPLMLVVAIFALPAVLGLARDLPAPWLVGLGLAMLASIVAPSSLYWTGQKALRVRWWRHLVWMPALTCVGIGVAASNARGVAEAVLGRPSEFVRTPKRGSCPRKRYAAARTVQPWIEILLGLYCAGSLVVYFSLGSYVIGPFLALYAVGFLVIGSAGLYELRPSRRSLSGQGTS